MSTVIVVFLIGLLGQPLFWICVTALLCATILAEGVVRAGQAIGLGIVRAARKRRALDR